MHVLPRTALLLVLAATNAIAAAGTAVAQVPAGRDSARAPARSGRRAIPGDSPACRTGPISYIFLDNHSIFDTSDPGMPRRFGWAYRTANRLHMRTRSGVIRREMLLRNGDCYDPALVEESARLLRGFDFISRADIYGIRQPDSTYHLVVDTQDEWSTDVGLRVALDRGIVFRGGRLREKNVFGSGQTVELYYIEHDVTRNYGLGWRDPQLGGTRWDIAGSVGRTRAGTVARQTLEYPFLGEAGRRAARESFQRTDELFDFVLSDLATNASTVALGDSGSLGALERDVLVPMRTKAFDLAFVGRLGRPGNLTLVGGGLSYVNRDFPGRVDLMLERDYSARTAADSSLVRRVTPQMTRRDDVRAVLLLGQRNISWVQKRGYDSPRGQQDIRLGAEVSAALSRSIAGLGDDDDLGASLSLYTGFEAGPALVVLRARGDGLRNFSSPASQAEWEDLYVDSELLTYLRWAAVPRHLLLLRGAATGGWQTRTPFQLTLGGDDAVRGYDPHLFPGGRRLSATAEDRIYFPWPFPELFDLGASVFADVGRVLPGDAPFGTDSGWRAAAGAGLRVAFPAGGRITYRADMAIPLNGGIRRARFILSVGEVLGLVTRRPSAQLERSRPQSLSGDLFTFPR